MGFGSQKHKKVAERQFTLKEPLSGFDKHLVVKTYRLPSGVLENFIINDDSDSVQIFAVTREKQVLVVKQFRAGLEQVNLELPGGGLEKGEDPMEAATRELCEETGFEGNFSFLGKLSYSPYSSGYRYVFVATQCFQVIPELELDENEFLEVGKIDLLEIREFAKKGKIRGHDLVYMGLDHLGLL